MQVNRYRRATKAFALSALVLAGVLAAPASARAPGKPIKSDTSAADPYYASARVDAEVKRVKKLWAVVSVSPDTAVQYDYTIFCKKKLAVTDSRYGGKVTNSGVIQLPRLFNKSKFCDVGIQAEYENFEAVGADPPPPATTVTIELRASRYRK